MQNHQHVQHDLGSQGQAGPSDLAANNPHWLRLPGSPKSDNNLLGSDRNKSDDSNEDKAERLSAGFSTVFTVFMSALMILTMCLLLYGNTTVGAYVQVQGIYTSIH